METIITGRRLLNPINWSSLYSPPRAQSLTTLWGCVLFIVTGLSGAMLVARGSVYLTAADFGLVLMYSGILQRAMMGYCMGLTTLEQNFVSVERCAEFMRLPQERGAGEEDHEIAASTTKELVSLSRASGSGEAEGGGEDHGVLEDSSSTPVAIDVRDLCLRYRLHKNPVLQSVSFQVQRGEKVGIVGRTGSGKSSLFSALAGLYDAQPSSRISIGGVELGSVTPTAWRASRFRMVSQDSALLSGTVRQNLLTSQVPSIPPDADSLLPDADPDKEDGARSEDSRCWDVLAHIRRGGLLINSGFSHCVREAVWTRGCCVREREALWTRGCCVREREAVWTRGCCVREAVWTRGCCVREAVEGAQETEGGVVDATSERIRTFNLFRAKGGGVGAWVWPTL